MGIELRVIVHKAEGLLNVETGGLLKKKDRKSDPFVKVTFKDKTFKTKVIDNELDPVFEEQFTFNLSAAIDASSMLDVDVYDHEKVGKDRSLGSASVNIGPLLKKGKFAQTSYPLQGKDGVQATGKIELTIEYSDPDNPPTETEGATTAEGTQSNGAAATGVEAEEGEEEEEEEVGGDGTKKRKPRAKLANRRGGKKRGNLSKKPADYQIRIHVIEGRSLHGTAIDPVVKIKLMDQRKQTRVIKTNANPRFNENFTFNVLESPAKLFDELLELNVYNAKSFFKDAFIGGFKIDVGMIYEEPNHMFANTWVMLTDIDAGDASVKGYLKVSLVVLTAGDEAVIPEEEEEDYDDEDFESKVLRPMGATLETIDLCFKIYLGEDIPQKDVSFATGIKTLDKLTGEGDKQNCDPFAKVVFAGKSNVTKVIDNTYFPEWYEEIHVPAQMPSMLNKIKFQVWDSDTPSGIVKLGLDKLQFADDVIATYYFLLNEIASSDVDNGFLPTFGPAYVTFYGGPRKFKTIYDDHLKRIDEGVGEGMSYRGRILCEVSSSPLGEKPKVDVNKLLTSIDKERVQLYMRKREYFLRVSLLEANMFEPDLFGSKDVSFEISIGNVGNTDMVPDDQPNPVNSITFPSPTVLDGSYYKRMPWDNKKPCVELISEWEDTVYRIWALNSYRKISKQLGEHLNNIALVLKDDPDDKTPLEEKQAKALRICNQAIEDLLLGCGKASPSLPEKIATRLDELLYSKRELERSNALAVCEELKASIAANTKGVDEVISELGNLHGRLQLDASESQICIPDVVLWVFYKDDRVAFYRFPIIDFIWSKDPDERGPLFGQSVSVLLRSPKAGPKKSKLDKTPGQMQLRIWFGLKEELPQWPRLNGNFVVLTEIYENQRYFPIKGWGDMLLPTDPDKFSDKKGKKKLNKSDFKEPPGWKWNGDWYIDPDLPEIDIYGDQDTVVIEVFENERKQPIKGYCKILLPTDPKSYSDRNGTTERTMESVVLPPGWMWVGNWQIDMNRAVDKDGWEYAVGFKAEFHPGARSIDFVRRRRWFIERVKDPKAPPEVFKEETQDNGDGWLYAIDYGQGFHISNNSLDSVRRRRFHRELIISDPKSFSSLADLPQELNAAGSFLALKGSCKYQFRAHLYQARELPAEDGNAFSDPYARVIFSGGSGRTRVIEKTITPTWDETITFEMDLYGNETDPEALFKELSTRVVVEIFDKDLIGDDDFLGRFTATPIFRSKSKPNPPVLDWYQCIRNEENSGELLCAFEIIPFKDKDAFPLPDKTTVKEPLTRKTLNIRKIPQDIRPEMEPCQIEMLTWGLRDLRRVWFLSVNKPHVEIECSGVIKISNPIKSVKKFPNFDSTTLTIDLDLPKKELYAPPINIRVFDNRKFGRKPLVGSFSIKTLNVFRVRTAEPPKEELNLQRPWIENTEAGTSAAIGNSAFDPDDVDPVQDETVAINKEESQKALLSLPDIIKIRKSEEKKKEEEVIDWWTKFYNSTKEEFSENYSGDLMEVYTEPLDNRYDFEIIVKTFYLKKGKYNDQEEMGRLKANFRVISKNQSPKPPTLDEIFKEKQDNLIGAPHPWASLPDKTPMAVLVRLYIVRGIQLQPRDSNGKSDPFVIVTFGKNKPINDKENYIARNLDPVFGRLFEMDCQFPRDAELKIEVFDWDMFGSNDIIGETKIDLENRLLSKRRATCGIPKTYQIDGINKWRDSQKPSQILEKICEVNHLGKPVYLEGDEGSPISVSVQEVNGGRPFSASDPLLCVSKEMAKENSALMILHYIGIVPEHVETRTLYDPMQPGMDQGKLQLWVDLFPKVDGPPGPPFNITPRKPKEFELRVVVWNTVEVAFADVSFAGEEMSDIYIKCMIRGMEKESQKTDVHYRSLNGEGNFNWRLVFPFKYIPPEKVVVIERRAHIFSSEFEVTKEPATLSVQIWDADIFGPDEYIGSIELDLNDMIMPAKKSSGAKLGKKKGASLFEKKRLKGWFACYSPDDEKKCTGKVELELEVVTKEEALDKPAGFAREDPNQYPTLDPPNRPDTSFLWFTSPWKTFKYIIWKNYKWYIILFLVLLIIAIAIVIFIYTAPSALMDEIVSKLSP